MMAVTLRRKRRGRGQALVEYALILMLVALAVIITLGAIGGSINNMFSTVNDALQPGGG